MTAQQDRLRKESMSLLLALLPLLLYALYKIIETGHDLKTFQARILEKQLPGAETVEHIIKRNLRLELENQEQLQAIARGGMSNKAAKSRTKKFNNRSRGTA
jgi:hypothetical protein